MPNLGASITGQIRNFHCFVSCRSLFLPRRYIFFHTHIQRKHQPLVKWPHVFGAHYSYVCMYLYVNCERVVCHALCWLFKTFLYTKCVMTYSGKGNGSLNIYFVKDIHFTSTFCIPLACGLGTYIRDPKIVR